MRRTVVVASMVAASVSCAGTPVFHDGPTGLNGRESRALLAAARGRPGGFERFWLRPGCRPGLIKWAGDRSHAVAQAPPALLGLIRDEIGRVNRLSRDGETAFLTITVFEWTRRMFGRPPRVGYEVVGRDRAGQVLWLGQERLVVPRERALDLAETDELLVAREIGRKLGAELGR
jgi:hypothetical protein